MIINMILLFVIGIILGSFLNSLIYRSYYNISLWKRSFCPRCKKFLKSKDLIPLLSFVFLKTKCRFCKEKIRWQYFWVELLTGILFVLVFLKYTALTLFLVRDLFFVFILIFIFMFDFKYYLILDKIIWPSLIVVMIVNLSLGIVVWNLLLGILIGGGFFLLQYVLTKGKGLGLGDVKLGALIGAMFGWQLTILVIFVAYIIGGVVTGFLLIGKKKKIGDILPMGTFLSLSAIIVILIGEKIINLII